MHHGKQPLDDLDIMHDEPGSTGRYPDGKLSTSDDGEIRISVGQNKGKVIVDFGTPTAWIGFGPSQAIEFANLLKQKALLAKGRK